jgi:hypothetical protein
MALAALAILGHRSAHSFPIGPVIADPTITSNTILKTRNQKTQQQKNSLKKWLKLLKKLVKKNKIVNHTKVADL